MRVGTDLCFLQGCVSAFRLILVFVNVETGNLVGVTVSSKLAISPDRFCENQYRMRTSKFQENACGHLQLQTATLHDPADLQSEPPFPKR